jgi:DNA-binding response OmpR family regulator
MTPSILIFVVEDEALIQATIQDALEEGGYSVVQSTSAEQAMEMLDADGTRFKALITDINLGSRGLTGWEVARHAREINHDLPVIYMTCDSGADWAVNGVPNSVLLTKPFAPAQVVTAVSHLLNVGPAL